jgi:deazaflavin-dependent oxidoreductase (nitroreductase family)
MKDSPRFPLVFWRVLHRMNRWMLSRYGQKSKAASRVLVLTTIGRKSGQPRSTPLQFERVEGLYYIASARGVRADWYRNLVACPKVDVQIGDMRFSTLAELMTDPGQVADFLELRLKRHPLFMGAMLRLEGLPRKYTRTDLEKFGERLTVVTLHQGTQAYQTVE